MSPVLEGGGDCHQGGRVEGTVTSAGGWKGLSPVLEGGGDCHQCGRAEGPSRLGAISFIPNT